MSKEYESAIGFIQNHHRTSNIYTPNVNGNIYSPKSKSYSCYPGHLFVYAISEQLTAGHFTYAINDSKYAGNLGSLRFFFPNQEEFINFCIHKYINFCTHKPIKILTLKELILKIEDLYLLTQIVATFDQDQKI